MTFLNKFLKKKEPSDHQSASREEGYNPLAEKHIPKESASSAQNSMDNSELLLKATSLLNSYPPSVPQTPITPAVEENTEKLSDLRNPKNTAVTAVLPIMAAKQPLQAQAQASSVPLYSNLKCPDCESHDLKEIESLPSMGSYKRRFCCLVCDTTFNADADSLIENEVTV